MSEPPDLEKPGRPIAHRRTSDGATHDLEEHLHAAALLAERFAEAWGASETAVLAALWHDVGRYTAEFQAMNHGERPEGISKASPRVRATGQSLECRRAWAMQRFPEAS